MMNTRGSEQRLDGLEKEVNINAQISTFDARISKCIDDALAPFWRELRARGLIRGPEQHDSHTPCDQPSSHINNTESHNLKTEPTSAQDSSHISNIEPDDKIGPLLDLKLAPLFQHFQKHYNSGGAQADPPANPEPHTSDAVVASSPFLRSNTATPDLPQTLADHGSSNLTTSSSIDATHITAAPALPAQQPIAPSRFAASSTPAAQYKHFQKLPVTSSSAALTAPPAFQIVAQFREYVFAIHFRLHMCLSAVSLDTLLLCTSPPIYKHEFEPPPVKAISCL